MQSPVPRLDAGTKSGISREFGSIVAIVIAPARAFAYITEAAPWRIAAVVTLLLSTAAVALIGPASWHVLVVRTPELQHLKGAALDQATRTFYLNLGLSAGVIPYWTAGLFAIGMTFSTPRKALEGRRFARFFSLALTAGIPAMIGDLLSSAATAVHPAVSYTTFAQLFLAFPDSLAALWPHGSDQQLIFLSGVDAFSLWSYIIIAYGYAALTGSSLERALLVSFMCAFAVTLGQALGG